ncbi:MAG: hypothetical protein BWZ10_02938 [candidate division BRC1 bacterium ADurb.BinA364]|nr:MAG: hypothetical protein BWZ10_02938 [candidate division BRC1 bacterium ADurb.BinA364]
MAVRLFDGAHVALGHEDSFVALDRAIEILALARSAHVAIDNVDHRVAIQLANVLRLLERGHAAGGRAIGQMLRIARAGALDKGNSLGRPAVGGAGDFALAGHGLDVFMGDDIRLAAAQFIEYRGVVGPKSGGLDDGADAHGLRLGAVFERDIEQSRPPGDGDDFGGQPCFDPGVFRDLPGQCLRPWLFESLIGRARRILFVERGQAPAETIRFFDENRVVARPGAFQRGGHASHAAADDEQRLAQFLVFGDGRGNLALLRLDDSHAHGIRGQHLRVFVVGLVAPGDLLAQIGALQQRLGREGE